MTLAVSLALSLLSWVSFAAYAALVLLDVVLAYLAVFAPVARRRRRRIPVWAGAYLFSELAHVFAAKKLVVWLLLHWLLPALGVVVSPAVHRQWRGEEVGRGYRGAYNLLVWMDTVTFLVCVNLFLRGYWSRDIVERVMQRSLKPMRQHKRVVSSTKTEDDTDDSVESSTSSSSVSSSPTNGRAHQQQQQQQSRVEAEQKQRRKQRAWDGERLRRLQEAAKLAQSRPPTKLSLWRMLNPLWKPSNVRVIRNVCYRLDEPERQDHPADMLDIYMDDRAFAEYQQTDTRVVPHRPVLFTVHGGGWVYGSKNEAGLPLLRHMASRGWVCVTVNYRLAPKYKYPQHLHDVKHALVWVKENIAKYGGDPDFVGVTGFSAGGHLSAMMGLTANDPAYDDPRLAAVKGVDLDTSLAFCVPWYPVLDVTHTHPDQWERIGGNVRMLFERIVIGKPYEGNEELYRAHSPLHVLERHILNAASSRAARLARGLLDGPDVPPLMIVHGTLDTLVSVEHVRYFVDRATAGLRDTPVCYVELPYTHHAFELLYGPRTAYTVDAACRFMCVVHDQYMHRRLQEHAVDRKLQSNYGSHDRSS